MPLKDSIISNLLSHHAGETGDVTIRGKKYTILHSLNDNKGANATGFTGVAAVDEKGQLFIAFRGTDPNDPVDLQAANFIAAGNKSPQLAKLDGFLDEVKKKATPEQVSGAIITAHSAGAQLGAATAQKLGIKDPEDNIAIEPFCLGGCPDASKVPGIEVSVTRAGQLTPVRQANFGAGTHNEKIYSKQYTVSVGNEPADLFKRMDDHKMESVADALNKKELEENNTKGGDNELLGMLGKQQLAAKAAANKPPAGFVEFEDRGDKDIKKPKKDPVLDALAPLMKDNPELGIIFAIFSLVMSQYKDFALSNETKTALANEVPEEDRNKPVKEVVDNLKDKGGEQGKAATAALKEELKAGDTGNKTVSQLARPDYSSLISNINLSPLAGVTIPESYRPMPGGGGGSLGLG